MAGTIELYGVFKPEFSTFNRVGVSGKAQCIYLTGDTEKAL